MRLSSIQIRKFKRFNDLTITGLSQNAKLVMLTGPNGSGKTSVFEAFNFWSSCINRNYEFDSEYHSRSTEADSEWRKTWERIQPIFHGENNNFTIENSFATNPHRTRRTFYIRSAYRHEPDFTAKGLKLSGNILDNSNRPLRLILIESRVSENYERMVGESLVALYDPKQKDKSAGEITEKIIGEVRTSMGAVFEDLVLDGPGNPLVGGTFRFTKGDSSGFHYKNLSGGEKAAFDLLLDFIVKKEAFNDTIFCIDEAELHMHTRLQSKLLQQLFKLIPENCQLWLSTHSIGMARMATTLHRSNPGEITFIDFHDRNFDETTVLTPIQPNRAFWENMFSTALDDLAELIVPRYVVFCEGKRLGSGGRKPSFDVAVYRQIFGERYPEIEFVSLGGTTEVEKSGDLLAKFLPKLASGIRFWSVFDRDDRSSGEIADLNAKNIQVLERRDLESYLWDDEIIQKLCVIHQKSDLTSEIVEKKMQLLLEMASKGKPNDDIKAISGQLYNFCKQKLNLTQCGNDAEGFAIATLAPLIEPGLCIYAELSSIVLTPMKIQES